MPILNRNHNMSDTSMGTSVLYFLKISKIDFGEMVLQTMQLFSLRNPADFDR